MDTTQPADTTNTDQNPVTTKGPKGDREKEVGAAATAAAPENPDLGPKAPQEPKGERAARLNGSTER
jgi:hypothetical protein